MNWQRKAVLNEDERKLSMKFLLGQPGTPASIYLTLRFNKTGEFSSSKMETESNTTQVGQVKKSHKDISRGGFYSGSFLGSFLVEKKRAAEAAL